METKSVEMTINRLTGQRYSEISGQISAEGLDQLWLADGGGGGVFFGTTQIGAGPSHSHSAEQIQGLANVATSGSYNDLSGRPSSIKNPYSLTAGEKSYDGSTSVSIGAADVGAIPAGAVKAIAIVSADSLPPDPDPHTLYIVPVEPAGK